MAAGREDGAAKVASVASFFVSRVDTEVDRRLETLAGGEKGDAAILGLRGTAAVAQAQSAYQHFHRTFAGERWEALRDKGARVQRPLWASTSTKNPGYSDLLYVDSLIGPATREHHARADAARLRGARHAEADGRRRPRRRPTPRCPAWPMPASTCSTWSRRSRTRASHSFAKSFDELLQSLTDKAATF